ncbi:MAG: SDR family NAD(P)-dependent oxidoreductase [Verrucomicrobiota bacterium]|nr:SDR family NAD(P)-dependent oxidoreductase [Verrucomicrobiota bacterium]
MSLRFEKLKSFSAVALTGGSSGIGYSLFKTLYTVNSSLRFCNISRSNPLPWAPDIALHHVSCDLSNRQSLADAVPQIESILSHDGGTGKILLINNSGFGTYGAYPMPNLEQHLEMLEVNIRGPVALTGALLPLLKKRGGAIVNVASTAAFQPTPYMGTYGATKAFILNWSLALNQDLKPYNIPVLAVCPGVTTTRFFERAGFDGATPKPFVQTADAVAWETLHALEKGRSLVVTGWHNKLLTTLSSIAPIRLRTAMAEIVLRKLRLEKK